MQRKFHTFAAILILSLMFSIFFLSLKSQTIFIQHSYGGSKMDIAYSIALDSNNNVIIVGKTNSFRNNTDVFIVKFDSAGNILWQKLWNPGTENDANETAFSVDVIKTGMFQDYIVLTGISSTNFGNRSFFLTFDPNGNLVCDILFLSDRDIVSYAIAVDNENNVIIGGTVGLVSKQGFLAKLHPTCDYFWFKKTSLDFTFIRDITIGPNNTIIVTGETNSTTIGGKDVIFGIFDTNGNPILFKSGIAAQDDVGYGIALDSANNIIVTGYTESFGSGLEDSFIIKLDQNLNLIWSKAFGGNESDISYSVATDNLNRIYITGYTESYGAGAKDTFVAEFDSAGNLIFSSTWGQAALTIGYDIEVDNNYNKYITGYLEIDFPNSLASFTPNLQTITAGINNLTINMTSFTPTFISIISNVSFLSGVLDSPVLEEAYYFVIQQEETPTETTPKETTPKETPTETTPKETTVTETITKTDTITTTVTETKTEFTATETKTETAKTETISTTLTTTEIVIDPLLEIKLYIIIALLSFILFLLIRHVFPFKKI